MSELEGIPFNAIDFVPYLWEIENENEESKRLKREYLAGQLLDAIDWMEKVTGEKFDAEKFINHVNWECEPTSLWPQCCMLNQSIPAVMDENDDVFFPYHSSFGTALERGVRMVSCLSYSAQIPPILRSRLEQEGTRYY